MKKLDERLSQNVQNTRQSHKVYRENHGKLESKIDSRRKKLIWRENPGRCTITINICDRRPDLVIVNKKKICLIVDFVVPADHRVKLKESEMRDKYLDISREVNKLWNMKVTVIPIVIGPLGRVTKRLVQGLEDLEIGGWMETIQITRLLRSTKKVLETWADMLTLKL